MTWLTIGYKWAEPVKNPILDVGRLAGVEPRIFQEYSSVRL